ncbi:NADH:flavin oxidoreductase/NADH oxidase [Corticimicrobacter populi]|uniref:Oxidoreductase n=1 Tax=Corticimicrobacter populi TaxID=2175229 RepID=A0A2V1K208_9BURK|nr:NADH:flavin oxidoreductase/NADH oxidase [Corticimicrobacter populi]PWF24181.1 oxidoreductase [Corticimicrobacter populi]
MTSLFSPLTLGPVEIPNRIVIAPMCQYSAENGLASDWHVQHLGGLAQSGAGLLILEATAVEPCGRISWADLGLWDDATQAALARVLASVRRYSHVPLGIQLAHAGRKASVARPWEGGLPLPPGDPHGWQTIAPSSLPFLPDGPAPQAASLSDLDDIVQAFAAAARRAAALGFEVIEIHAAHGYLLHQFLSPLANRREDDYGGTLENRLRLTLRVFDAVRAAVPASRAVGVRISASDWVEGGWDVAQSIELARQLEQRGSHFIHVSSGGLSTLQQIPLHAGYQVPFAEEIRRQVGTPVIAVGLITEPHHAQAILDQGQADAIGIARGVLYDPRWPWHAAAALGRTVPVAPQYLRAEPHDVKGVLVPAAPWPHG